MIGDMFDIFFTLLNKESKTSEDNNVGAELTEYHFNVLDEKIFLKKLYFVDFYFFRGHEIFETHLIKHFHKAAFGFRKITSLLLESLVKQIKIST